MNKRKLKLDKYGITKSRYKELCGFCEQYPAWKQRLKDHAYVSSVGYKMTPGNPNKGTTDMTGNTAVKLSKIQANVDLIERVARQVDIDYWEAIIASVCYELSPNYIIAYHELPISQSAFYERRRYFFYILDKEKDL